MTQFTIPEGSGNVILSYVRQKAAEYSIERMVERVADSVRLLEEAIRAVPEAQLEVVSPGQEWSPIFAIRHVTAINLSTSTRSASVATTGALPTSEPPALPEEREGALAEHARLVGEALERIRGASEDAYRDVTWTHPLLGELTWREWLLTVRVHSLAHADQLRAMMAAAEGASNGGLAERSS